MDLFLIWICVLKFHRYWLKEFVFILSVNIHCQYKLKYIITGY